MHIFDGGTTIRKSFFVLVIKREIINIFFKNVFKNLNIILPRNKNRNIMSV